MLAPLRYNQVDVFQGTTRLLYLTGGGALLYAAYLVLHRRLPGPTRLDWALTATLGAYALAVAFSISPRFSLEAAFLMVLPILVFYLLSDVDELTPPLMIRGLAGVGIAGAVAALAQVQGDLAEWRALVSGVEGSASLWDLPPSVPRVHDVGDHVNMIAMAFNMTLPFALTVALRGRGLERAVAGAGAGLILLALFFTVSRAAWAGAALALPLFVVLYMLRDRGLPRDLHVRVSSRLLAAALAIVVLITLALALALSRWDSRPEWLFRSSLSPRYDAFEVALRIGRDEPLFGSGPNTFSLLYNVYSGDYPIENFHPHNGYLAVLVDAGVVGVVAVGFTGALLLGILVAEYRTAPPDRRVWIAACLAALAAVAIHSLADMPNQSKTALVMLAAVTALALKVSRRPIDTPRLASPSNIPRLAVLVTASLLLGAWSWTYQSHDDYDSSLGHLKAGRFSEAAMAAQTAASEDPSFAAYHFHAGVTQAVAYMVARDAGDDLPGRLDAAIASLRRGLELDSRAAIGYANLALAYRLKEDPGPAIEAARFAMLRAPRDGTIAAVAGLVFEWAELFDEATTAYAVAVTHDPTLIESRFWTTTPYRRAARDDVLAGTFLSGCQKARTAALYGRFPEDRDDEFTGACTREVEASPGDPRLRSDLAIALSRAGDRQRAEGDARLAVSLAPDNAAARTALGFVLLSPETIEEARHNLVLAAQLGDADALLLLAMSYESSVLPGGDIPNQVIERMRAALPGAAPFVYDNGVQHYLLGLLYYRPRFFRESPTTLLIPSELTAPAGESPLIESPRVEAMKRILDAGR